MIFEFYARETILLGRCVLSIDFDKETKSKVFNTEMNTLPREGVLHITIHSGT